MAPKRIAIIGGGFSGLMVATHLVREATQPLTIDWYDATGDWGRGVAYGASELVHLLNVRAKNMGAFAAEPLGFWHWLEAQPENIYTPDDFVPRPVYGAYLQTILQKTLALARAKDIALQQHCKAVSSAAELGDYAALVLACGTPPPRLFTVAEGASYLPNPWDTTLWQAEMAALTPQSRVIIIGTGLTAVDRILSLEAAGFRGQITAISRHGWWPQAHRATPPLPYTAPDWLAVTAPTAYELLRRLRQEVAALGSWHEVVDSLRPVTTALWQRLPLREKRKILNRLLTLWNIHRHRMAPEIAEKLSLLQKEGRLTTFADGVQAIDPHGVRLHNGEVYEAALVINCTGPDFNLTRTTQPLLRELLRSGAIAPDAVGMGMAMPCHAAIFPVGALTVGSYFESFAIPELREQASTTALGITRGMGEV